MGEHGGSYARFRRALENGSPVVALAAARELQQLGLTDALALCLVLRGDPARYSHAVTRWHSRYAAETRGVSRSPADGLAPSEVPRQRNARPVEVLDAATIARLVNAAASERWRAALALAGFAGLRLGEIRALEWDDVDLEAGTLTVARSMSPGGALKTPKTDAGARVVPILPALGRVLVEWRLRSPHTRPGDLVVCTADGRSVQERNVRRALDDAKTAAGLAETDGRLSTHSLRHSFASMLATDLALPATSLARLTGHADAGFTLRVYARDGRDDAALVDDVLARASWAGIAG